MFEDFLHFFLIVSAIGSWMEFVRYANQKMKEIDDDADR